MDRESHDLARRIETNSITFESPDHLAVKTIPTLERYLLELKLKGNEQYQAGYQLMVDVARDISEKHGMALLVGGAVRDMIQGNLVKDFDLEVYDLSVDELAAVAKRYGKVSEVGKSFGILKVATSSGIDLDLSQPREDSKIGEGHKGFAVRTDQSMLIREACQRRDFTINAMAADPISGKIYDPYGGFEDLEEGVLRVVDPVTFVEDPLRVMRGVQFAGRFNLTPDAKTLEVMRALSPKLTELPSERLFEEWKKLLLKSEKPSVGLQLAKDAGVLAAVHPEFLPLEETEQDPRWHPEGDVFVHTKLGLDQAAKIIRRDNFADNEALTLMLAILCHDLGKPQTTKRDEHGHITAHGHDEAGVLPSKQFLRTIHADTLTKDKVTKLVEYHMWPHNTFQMYGRGQDTTDGAVRKLAHRLFPATIDELAYLAEADHSGTGYYVGEDSRLVLPVHFQEGIWLRQKASALSVEKGRPQPVIRGQDLLSLGLEPGAKFGEIIRLAEQLHNDDGVSKEAILASIKDVSSTEEAIDRLHSQVVSVSAL